MLGAVTVVGCQAAQITVGGKRLVVGNEAADPRSVLGALLSGSAPGRRNWWRRPRRPASTGRHTEAPAADEPRAPLVWAYRPAALWPVLNRGL